MDKNTLGNFGILTMRIVLGSIFLAHGLQKLFGVFDGPGIDGTAKVLEGLGFVGPVFWAYTLALLETVGGIFMILGIMPRVTAAAMIAILTLAILKVSWPNGFFLKNGGYEYNLALLAMSFSVLLSGAGDFSFFDRL